MENLQLDQIHPLQIENVWGEIGPWILQAVGEGYDVADANYIKETAQRGASIIWVVHVQNKIEAVLVTEQAFYGGKRTLVLRWFTGRGVKDMLHLYNLIEDWAFKNGYEYIEAWGHRGWEKVLKPYGFTHQFTVVGKPIMKRMH